MKPDIVYGAYGFDDHDSKNLGHLCGNIECPNKFNWKPINKEKPPENIHLLLFYKGTFYVAYKQDERWYDHLDYAVPFLKDAKYWCELVSPNKFHEY